MKIVMAKTAVDFLRRPVSPGEDDQAFAARAAHDAAQLLRERGRGTGGIILLDKSGTPAFAFNTPRMAYGYVSPPGDFLTFA